MQIEVDGADETYKRMDGWMKYFEEREEKGNKRIIKQGRHIVPEQIQFENWQHQTRYANSAAEHFL